MHPFSDSKTTYTISEENWLQLSPTIQTTQSSKQLKYPENKNGKENNSMGTSNEKNKTKKKKTKSHTRKLKHGSEMETESLLIAKKNNAIRPSYIKAKVDKKQQM